MYLYDAAGTVIGMQYHAAGSASTAWDSYWFEKNLQGDVVAIYDDDGNKLISYVYDAWGNFNVTNVITEVPFVVANNPFTYRGYYYDYDLGLYYLQSRYYDSVVCRFISDDEVNFLGVNGDLNSYNLFAYCSNNPVMYSDPSGHFAITLTTLLLGGLIAGTIGAGIGFGATYILDVVENVKEDDFQWNDLNTFADNWDHYLGATVGGFVSGFGVGFCTILGAGVGAAVLGGTTATLFTTAGLSLSLGSSLTIGSSVAFVTGMAGYALRTAISGRENFNGFNMLVAGGFNAISGAFSVLGGALGGYAGVHNTVFTKLLSQKGDFLARVLIENIFTAGFKISGAFIKDYFMI